ncbi:MAG TPA: hypothetical protein VN821_11130 [Candidatus Udaeobacter sp.]|nr:hypothetical protein [Candidatus Udaeobacter sp.]
MAVTTLFAGSIPGLHGDEAWVLRQVAEISKGARPLSGMTSYSGALNQYLLWPFLAAGGYGVWTLRAVCGAANAVAALLALAIVRVLHPGDRAILRWTGALWVTSVPFVLFSRFAIELTMLTPLLVLGAVWLASVAIRAKSAARFALAGLGSGLTLGLAVYNHVIAIAIVAALLFGAFAGFDRPLFRKRIFWLVAAGLAIGSVPALANLARALPGPSPAAEVHELPSPQSLADAREEAAPPRSLQRLMKSAGDLIRDLAYLPTALAGMLDGDLMFRQFTGETLLPVVPYFSLALLGFGCAGWWRGRKGTLTPIDRSLLAAWLAMPIAIRVVAPYMPLRLFELPALVAPYALVRFALPAAGRAGTGRAWIGHAALGAVLALQVGYVATDYFWAFARSGGRLSYFQLGTNLAETSNDFVRTDALYRQLVDAGVGEVIGPWLLVSSLSGDDLPYHRLVVVPLDLATLGTEAAAPRASNGRIAIVIYNITAPPGGERLNELLAAPEFDAGALKYLRAPGFDDKFAVLVGDPAVETGDTAKKP